MLTFAFASILLGLLLLYAGWSGKSLRALLLGDNQTQALKPDGTPRAALGFGGAFTGGSGGGAGGGGGGGGAF